MEEIIIDGFTYKPSTRKNKKYDVFKADTYITSFGHSNYDQYFDLVGKYATNNHLDPVRRRLYYRRHGKTTDKLSPKYHSNKILWGSDTVIKDYMTRLAKGVLDVKREVKGDNLNKWLKDYIDKVDKKLKKLKIL